LLKLLIRERYETFAEQDDKTKKKFDKTKFEPELKNIILFSFVWSFGSLLNSEDRAACNKLLGEMMKGKVDVSDE
jgi:hypothetical protein